MSVLALAALPYPPAFAAAAPSPHVRHTLRPDVGPQHPTFLLGPPGSAFCALTQASRSEKTEAGDATRLRPRQGEQAHHRAVERNALRIGVKLQAGGLDRGEFLADAEAFEAAGVDGLWLSEGLFRPAEVESCHSPGLDAWTLLAGIAAVTHRVRLGTSVSVVAMWPPALFATMVTTLDHLSRGRVIVGVGAGWEPAQFGAVGVDFTRRGARLDEFLAAVRHLWSNPTEPFQGTFYDLPALRTAPPVQPGGPRVLVGAFSEPGYRRAARLGDGFIHGGGTPDQVAGVFERVRDLRARAGLAEPFDLWTEVSSPRDRAAWRETLEAVAPTGATGIIVPASARLLEMLRNPDDEGDRSDLLLAQG